MRRFSTLSIGLASAILGCGDDTVHHLTDAPVHPDGAIVVDAAPDAPPAVTTVTTLAREDSGVSNSSDTPIPGVSVIVLNADLSAGPTATTDANGKATFASLQPGSIVTVAYPDDFRVITVVDVKPGANLVFGDHYFQPQFAESPTTTLTVSWPAVPAATNVSVFTPCGDASGDGTETLSGTISVNQNCAGSNVPIQFLANNGSGNVDAGWIASAPVGSAAIALPAWTAFPSTPNYTMTLTGFPATTEIIYANERTAYMPIARTGGDHNFSAGDSTTLDGSGNGTVAVITALEGARTTAELDYETTEASANGYGEHHAFRVGPSGATTQAFTPSGLPFIGNTVTVSTADQTVSWAEVAGATTHGDYAFAELTWIDGENFHDWTIIAPPPATTQLSWAGFPAALAAYLPPATAEVSATIELVDIAAVTSYDQAIALPEWQLTQSANAMLDGDVASADVADGGEGSAEKHARLKRQAMPLGAARAKAKAYAIAHPSTKRAH